MKSFCLNCRKDTENINARISNTSNGKTMILSKCGICASKKSRFIKNQEAKVLLSNLGTRTPSSKVPLLGDIFVLMCEKNLKQPGFTYSACRPFTKNKKRIQKFKETRDTSYIYKNKLDKLVFNVSCLMEVL